MNQSHKSYQLQTLLVLALVAFASLACTFFQPVIGNVFSNTFTDLGAMPSTPESVAQAWTEALFNADGQVLRDNMCQLQRAAITDDVVSSLSSSIGGSGLTLDISGITYTFNDATRIVTLGGNIKATMSGTSVDVPMDSFPLKELPVVNENGRWFVCLNLNDMMGG